MGRDVSSNGSDESFGALRSDDTGSSVPPLIPSCKKGCECSLVKHDNVMEE